MVALTTPTHTGDKHRDVEGAPPHVMAFMEHFYSVPWMTYRYLFLVFIKNCLKWLSPRDLPAHFMLLQADVIDVM